MPISDPEKRRQANADRMRRRRAEKADWTDPAKEAERKRRWYEAGGKERLIEGTRQRRQQAKDQGLAALMRKLLEPS